MALPHAASALTRRELVAALGGGAVLSRAGTSWARQAAPHLPGAADAWHYATLAAMAKRIEAKTVSPVELTRRMLDRITALEPSPSTFRAVRRCRSPAGSPPKACRSACSSSAGR